MDDSDDISFEGDGDYSTIITDPDTGESYDTSVSSDTASLLGNGNAPPLVSDPPQSSASGGIAQPTTSNLLGSIGSILGNAPKIGTALGTAVGTAEHNVQQGITNFNGASSTAASGNSLGTWWTYASTTDKLMVGLAVVGIFVALKK